MWFLLLQIFILMLLAAALGAALMWWWLSRKHESIAQSRERLLAQTSRLDVIATREDLDRQISTLVTAINGKLQPVETKLQAVRQSVADIRVPETDLSPVQQRIDAMEARLAAFSLDPVMLRMGEVGDAVAQVQPGMSGRLDRIEAALREMSGDLGPVHTGIASLGLSINTLEPKLDDLSARVESGHRNDMDILAARFATLSNALSGLQAPDIAPVQQRLSEVQAAIANLHVPDIGPMQQRLIELQAAVANIPQPNLQSLHASLSDLETFVVALDRPPQDLGPLFNRLAALESAMAGVHAEVRDAAALRPIDRRLAGIEEAIGGLPGPDLTPVLGAVRAIDNRNDLVAMENRLTAIEYGLAALHHMLRSRPDGSRADVGEGRAAPALQVVRAAELQPAPQRPDRDADPINAFRRAGDEANLMSEPAFGPPDDFERIDGVGPMLRALLYDIGVYYFWQVAEWTAHEIDWVETKLMHFRGRIRRDDWVGQARALANSPGTAKRPSQLARRPLA